MERAEASACCDDAAVLKNIITEVRIWVEELRSQVFKLPRDWKPASSVRSGRLYTKGIKPQPTIIPFPSVFFVYPLVFLQN